MRFSLRIVSRRKYSEVWDLLDVPQKFRRYVLPPSVWCKVLVLKSCELLVPGHQTTRC